jgi:hypothetical protein
MPPSMALLSANGLRAEQFRPLETVPSSAGLAHETTGSSTERSMTVALEVGFCDVEDGVSRTA